MKIKAFALYTLIVAISVSLLTELYLRVTHKYEVFSEMNGMPFYSELGQTEKSWFHTRKPGDGFIPSSPDFKYAYSINSLGFRDSNYNTSKNKSTLRILVTGDSFAEGEGAPYDSTWPRILEKRLQQRGIPAQVIDAGVAGSDPFYNYTFYKERLKDWHPDLVIASFNSSDYYDYLNRGGMERFQQNGTVRNKPAPWYMFFYAHSRLVRALLHKVCDFRTTGIFLSQKHFDQATYHINSTYTTVFKNYQSVANQNGAAFVAMVHTTPSEITLPQLAVIQTLRRSLNGLADLLNKDSVPCINLSAPLTNRFAQTPMRQLSYPHDLHYTPLGYAYIGRIMADSLIARGLAKPIE